MDSATAPLYKLPGNSAMPVTLTVLFDRASKLLDFSGPAPGDLGVRALIQDMYWDEGGDTEELVPFISLLVCRLERFNQRTVVARRRAAPKEAALTPQEIRVLRLIANGYSNKLIARDLRIAPETVKSHTKHIFCKLGTRTRAESTARAMKLSLL